MTAQVTLVRTQIGLGPPQRVRREFNQLQTVEYLKTVLGSVDPQHPTQESLRLGTTIAIDYDAALAPVVASVAGAAPRRIVPVATVEVIALRVLLDQVRLLVDLVLPAHVDPPSLGLRGSRTLRPVGGIASSTAWASSVSWSWGERLLGPDVELHLVQGHQRPSSRSSRRSS